MNKRAAKARALEGTLSIGDLRTMIRETSAVGHSTVNPAITLEKALEIYLAAIKERKDSEVPKVWKLDVYSGREKPTRDVLLITNILRDCA